MFPLEQIWKRDVVIDKQNVKEFIDAINIFLKWIQQYW